MLVREGGRFVIKRIKSEKLRVAEGLIAGLVGWVEFWKVVVENIRPGRKLPYFPCLRAG